MPLDYNFTCPIIDRGIDSFRGDIEQLLTNMVEECCPLLDGDYKRSFIKGYSDSLYESLEPIFETIRSENSNIRSQADKQISDLQHELEDKMSEIDSLQDEINSLS